MLHLMNKIILKPGKDRSVFRYHPWIFSGAIAKTEGKLQEGDLVRVYSSDNQYLATGHYQIGSIAVRILTFEDEEIGYSFWLQRITAAYHMRRAIGLTDRADNDTFRLIHGEGDNLPGLVVDYYAGVCVENHINRHPSFDHQQKHCGTVFSTGKTYGMKLFLNTPTHVGSTRESSFRWVRVHRCTFCHPGNR